MRAVIRYSAERRWFAWYPVRLHSGGWAWCEYVAYCRRIAGGFGYAFDNLLYRRVSATEPLDGAG